MNNSEKKPKWDAADADSKGAESVLLTAKYKTQLEGRFKADEWEQHEANVNEFTLRRSGQHENLTEQKSKTLGLDNSMNNVQEYVISMRNVVKSKSPDTDLSKAFGIGDNIVKNVIGVNAAANRIFKGYADNTTWANDAGILASDIEKGKRLVELMFKAEKAQGDSKFARKSETKDKNTLQREIEDEVTRISAIGYLVFKDDDAAAASLFAGLIPPSGSKGDKPTNGTDTDTKA